MQDVPIFSLKNVKYMDILNIEKLDIFQNKITCIIGESGSGKTTLLRLLNNLVSCDSGDILFMGKNINDIDPIDLRRKVVMLPQIPAIFDGNIRENLLIGLKFSEKSMVGDQELRKVMQIVECQKELTDNADKLSGGERQRLALARIMLLDPDVMLLDEPSSALDDETANIVIKNMANYAKQNNKTLVMVTHSKEIAEIYGEVIVEIKKGKLNNEKRAVNE
jgi:putative ABC transport system ATP-binding protein